MLICSGFKTVSHYFPFMLFSPYWRLFPSQEKIVEELKKHEEEVELFQETYDSIVAEDKVSW